jgi:hypothetical protein
MYQREKLAPRAKQNSIMQQVMQICIAQHSNVQGNVMHGSLSD